MRMSFFNESMSIIENCYYFSGVLIALFALIGLYQLVLTKRAIKTSSLRQSGTLSANQIEIYFNKIIPLIDTFSNATEGQPKLPTPKVEEFNREYIKKVISKEDLQNAVIILSKNSASWLRVINSLEAMSVYFVKGIADEEIGFASIGNLFVDYIESKYVLFAVLRDDKKSCYFRNTIELYKLWKDRLEKDQLIMEKKDLENKIKSIKDNKINPIGT